MLRHVIWHATLNAPPKPGLALDLRFGLIENREQFNDYHSIGLADDIEREPSASRRGEAIYAWRSAHGDPHHRSSAVHPPRSGGLHVGRGRHALHRLPCRPSHRSFSGTVIRLSSTASSRPSRRRISMVFPRLARSWTSRGRSWNTFRRWSRCLFAAPARRPPSMRSDSRGR